MYLRWRSCKLIFSAITLLTLSLPVVAQVCTKSTQTDVCLFLVPNNNVLTSLPEALQIRNNEQVTFHLSNVSPLELCKLTGATFVTASPASAAQGAVTAIMGIAPFGVGGLLSNVPSDADMTRALDMSGQAFRSIQKVPAPPPDDPIKRAIEKQTDVIDKATRLFAVQAARQQDGAAIAAMYSTFSVSDFRSPGSFTPAYAALSAALAESFKYVLPGEQAAPAGTVNRRVTAANSGGLLNDVTPVVDPQANGIYIVDLQSELDEAKSLIGTAHNLYDKDLAKLAALKDSYATSDRLQSIATQFLVLIGANDTALKLQQTSLTTLKLTIDQLKRTAFDAAGAPKETVLLPIPRAKNGTLTGNITCVNRIDNTKVTLDPMPYSVQYQKVPLLSFSTGILFSPIQKQVFGTIIVKDTSTPTPTTIPPTPVATLTEVARTDSSSFQVVPFSFLSLRVGPGWSYRAPIPKAGVTTKSLYDFHPKLAHFLSRRVFACGVTGGFGVNPNGGTTDPEFFAGLFGSVDRLILHLGLDEGRIQTLSGQFFLGDIVPPGTTISPGHHFVGKLSGAISVRLYP